MRRHFFQFPDNGGVLFREVGYFADFLFQVVEAASPGQVRIALANSHAEGLTGESQFPWSLPDGLQFGALKIMPGITRGRFGFAEHPRRYVHAINLDVFSDFAASQ